MPRHDSVSVAWKYHREGNSRRAEQIARQLRRSEPENAEVYFLLGAICLDGCRGEEAAEYFRAAIKLRDDFAEAHNNLGNALVTMGQVQQAVVSYKRALELHPNYAEAHNNLGNVLRQLGELDQAQHCFEKALENKAAYPEALNNLGLVLRARNQPAEAMRSFRRALALRPDYPEASNNLGIVYAVAGNFDEAIACFEMAIARKPEYVDAHSNLGIALMESAQYERAEVAFERLLVASPKSAVAHMQLGKCLMKLRRFADAAYSFRQAIYLNDRIPEAHNLLGEALIELKEYHEALACFDAATAMAANFPAAHTNRGIVLTSLGESTAALAAYDEAIRHAPDFQRAHVNRAIVLLSHERLREGWSELIWQWRGDENLQQPPNRPWWNGEVLAGRTILIDTDDQIENAILFTRFASVLNERGARVILQCPKSLRSILSHCKGVSEVVEAGANLQGVDYQSHLLSLPHILETNVESIPAKTPYLEAAAECPPEYRAKVSELCGLKIGISATCNSRFETEPGRTIPSAYFRLLSAIDGISLVALNKFQNGDHRKPIARLVELPELDEAADRHESLAALMGHLDVIITSDSLVAHIAGALGIPVWVLLPWNAEWCWFKGRSDSPWYPSARLFRQSQPGNWTSVFQQVVTQLHEMIGQSPKQATLSISEELLADVLNEVGMEELSQGNHSEAITSYRQALVASPRSAEAHCNLARELRRQGKTEAATEHYEMALQINPEYAEAYNSLGILLASFGKHNDAIAKFKEAVRIKPDYSHAFSNMGVAQLQLNDLDAAIENLNRAVEIDPSFAKAHANLGNTWRKKGSLEKARESFLRAIELDGENAEVHLNLGIVARDLDDTKGSLEQLQEAIRLRPRYAEAYNNLGITLARVERFEEAHQAYRNALRVSPGEADAHNNLGIVLSRLHRTSEAIASYREALRIRPSYAEAHNNIGIALTELEEHDAAIEHFEQSIRLRPDYAAAYSNLGISLAEKGEAESALANYDKAVELAPSYPEGHMNRALSLLQQSQFEKGWEEYDWRWKCKDSKMPPFQQPVWNGEPLEGKTIVLHSEQGLGDTLQFIRYAALVKQSASTVIAMCPERLLPILSRTRGVDKWMVKDKKEPLPECDYHVPLMNLPRLFKTTVQNVPNQVPYIFPDPTLAVQWKRSLSSYRGFKIGINWQGNPQYRGDRHRSIPIVHFAALAHIKGCTLISVQKNFGTEQISDVSRYMPIIDLGSQLDDETGPFMDTAAVLTNLDLMITSDTALAHLAGGLGIRVWLAVPQACDWRWLRGRDDCPWYPNMRLYRQTQIGNWGEVFERIADDLRVCVSKGQSPTSVHVEISPGELIDKITILELKKELFRDTDKKKSVEYELTELSAVLNESLPSSPELTKLSNRLREINRKLWHVEDEIRECELRDDFGPDFVALARSVYQNNDSRSQIKRDINVLFKSKLIEQKQYSEYKTPTAVT